MQSGGFMKYIVIILYVLALLFLPLHWLSGISVVGIVGYVALLIGSILVIVKSFIDRKK